MDSSKAFAGVVTYGDRVGNASVGAGKWLRRSFGEGRCSNSGKQKPPLAPGGVGFRRFSENWGRSSWGGSSSSQGDEAQQPIIRASPAAQTRLNPSAKEWDPSTQRAPEEDRCLFLTFSNGYPLNENQIVSFFTSKFGPCVENVYVHWPEPRNIEARPLFGKVVFNVSYIPAMILGAEKQTKFMVDGKPLWCKKFEANKKQQARRAINY